MNILFLSLSNMKDINGRGIYTDLVRELHSNGISMYVVSPRQRREELKTELEVQDGINILRVKTGNITANKSNVEKGIATLRIQNQYLKAIKKHFPKVKFDMVLYSTPPITFNKVIKYFKKNHGSKTYLMLKDIFPQNAVDIEIMKKNGLLHRFFRRKEIELYKNSDTIGCMSQGNVDYLLKHNQYIDEEKVEIFPNSIKPIDVNDIKRNKNILTKYKVPKDKVLFLYGGNLGKPQGIDFILKVIDNFHKVENGYFLVVGSGTEFKNIQNHIDVNKPHNIKILSKLPKEDYDKIVASADVGLIFLDDRFTIPNIPSRLLSYMEQEVPVLAATDANTDLKAIIKKSGCGLWCESKNTDVFITNSNLLAKNEKRRLQFGNNGRLFLKENFDVSKNINKIIDLFQ